MHRRKISELGNAVTNRAHAPIVKFPVFPAMFPENYEQVSEYAPLDPSLGHSRLSDIGFYNIRDCWLAGRGFLWLNDKPVTEPDLMPAYVRDMLQNGARDDALPSSSRAKRHISKPTLLLTAEAHLVYGHWLLDYIPRVWLCREYLDMKEIQLILPHDTPQFAREIISTLLPDAEVTTWDWFLEDVHFDSLIAPSMLHNSHIFHPAFNIFISSILDIYGCGPSGNHNDRRIWVSRLGFASGSYQRRLSNEEEIILRLREEGFEIVHPQNLNWKEQIELFASAKVIAGEAGSGLHNAVFAPKHARIVALRPVNHVQSGISLLRNQTVTYIEPDFESDQAHGAVAYSVNVNSIISATK